MKKVVSLVLTGVVLLLALSGCAGQEPKTVTAFCGSASKPAMEEAVQAFRSKTGIQVYCQLRRLGDDAFPDRAVQEW